MQASASVHSWLCTLAEREDTSLENGWTGIGTFGLVCSRFSCFSENNRSTKTWLQKAAHTRYFWKKKLDQLDISDPRRVTCGDNPTMIISALSTRERFKKPLMNPPSSKTPLSPGQQAQSESRWRTPVQHPAGIKSRIILRTRYRQMQLKGKVNVVPGCSRFSFPLYMMDVDQWMYLEFQIFQTFPVFQALWTL